MKSKRVLKSILSFVLAVVISIPCFSASVIAENVIYIRSEEDLVKMAKDCRLDTFSVGKTFVLGSDVILGADTEIQIPVFRGIFDGSGHTISGFVVKSSIAPAGLFGIIESDGVVKNLNLVGKIIPSGDGNAIGGLVGVNFGLVLNCKFEGGVSGKEEIGGIAGVNDFSGVIRDSSVKGKVIGQKMTGGVVGNNHGLVDNCNNECIVNIDSNDPTINIDEIESGIQSAIIDTEKAEKIYSAIEDAGGIAGFSDGIVTNCKNKGDVGYSHIGYNIGGVIGRNQGFVYGSENFGAINGRREVGGVVGQAEPFVSSRPTGDHVADIRNELYTLSNLVDKATLDVDNASLRTSNRLTNITNILSKANDNVNDLTDSLTDFMDENIKEVNRGSDVAKSVSKRLESITEKLPGISRSITNASNSLSRGMDEAKKAGDKASDAMGDFSLAADDLNKAMDNLDKAGTYISDGADKISAAITVDDLGVEHIDWTMVNNGVEMISKGLDILDYSYLSSASDHIKDGSVKLKDAGPDLKNALNYFEDASDYISNASRELTVVLDEVSSLSAFLSNTDALQFSYIKSRTERSSNDLHNNMTNLNRELLALNAETKSSSDVLMADIKAINEQFFVVMDLLLDEIDDIGSVSVTSRIVDVSDEDINNSTDGKIQFCVNRGDVFGDINVGGITGSMGIFNKQNPEEDNSTINDTLRARYKLKAILQNCINYGDITSKKDYVGAICGISTLGIITDCKGYGNAVSDDGEYAGGISGANSTTIRNSFAKCGISGKKYVGGIAGLNSTKDNGGGVIENCVSAINIISPKQYSGAICGYDEGVIKDNYFFGDYTGINNASYSGKAEPVSFEELLALENLPEEFRRFKVTFVAESVVIKEIYLDYLGSCLEESFPEVPREEGKYGKWDSDGISDIVFDKVVTAEYFPYITALESGRDNLDNPSKFLAIGKFSDESTLLSEPESVSEEEIESLNLPGELFTCITPKEDWRVTVEDMEGDDVHLRYLRGDAKEGSVKLYIKNNEIWEKLKSKDVGAYVEFEVPSGTSIIAVAESRSYRMILVIAGMIILVVLIIFGIHIRRKRKLIKNME